MALRPTGDAPEAGWVELRRSFTGQVLFHTGTGEVKRLEGRWNIDFQGGFAVLLRTDAPGGASSWWANELLVNYSLLLAPRPGFQEDQLLVLDRSTHALEWRQTVYDTDIRTKVVQAIGQAAPALEAFVSRLPRPNFRVRFGINRVIWHCLGNSMDGRWVCKPFASFKRFAASIGFAEHDFVNSAKSVKMKQLKSGASAADPESWAQHDSEFSCSAVGVMSVLLQVLVGGKLKGRGIDSEKRASDALLSFVTMFGASDCQLEVANNDGDKLGIIQIAEGVIVGATDCDGKLEALIGELGGGIVSALMRCARTSRRGSKASGHSTAVVLLQSFGGCLMASLEASVDGGVFDDLDHLDLDVVFRESSSRPRRVSKEYKMLISSEVARQPSLRNPQQFLAASAMQRGGRAKNIGGKSSPPSRTGLRPAAGRLFCKSNMKQYLATVARDLSETRHAYIGMDATRVSNLDLMLIAFENTETNLSCWLAPQVLRDTRLRKDAPGSEPTQAELTTWRKKAAAALSQRVRESGESAKAACKLRKRLARLPKLATYDWLVSLQNSLEVSIGKGFEHWQAKRPERHRDEDFAPNETDEDNLLMVCSDQEQKQLAGLFFLQRKLHVNVEILPPPFHRRHNDVSAAMVRARVYDICILTIFQRNINYGPWNKGGNMNEMWEAGLELMAHASESDPLVVKLWPSICHDRGWTEPDQQGAEARRAFLKGLALERPFSVKGPRAAPSKWFSIWQAIDFERRIATVKWLGIAFVALQKGWIHKFDELKVDNIKVHPTQPAQQPSAGASSSGAASSSSAAPRQGSVSKAAAKAKGRAKVSGVMSKSQNALHAVARLSNLDYRAMQEMMSIVAEGLYHEHSELVSGLRGVEAVKQYWRSMALGGWQAPLRQAIGSLRQSQKLSKVHGITVNFSQALTMSLPISDPRVVAENSFCETMWRICASVLTERCASMMGHTCGYPVMLAGLLGAQEEQVATLTLFKEHWQAYVAAREAGVPRLTALCDRCSLNTRAMETTARYAKQSGWQMSEQLSLRAHIMFSGIGQEQLLEDSLGKIRDAEHRDASSRVVRMWKAYEVPVTEGQLTNFGRKEVAASGSIDLGVSCENDETIFKAVGPSKKLDFSAVSKTGKEQDWETFNTLGLRKLPAELELLRHLHALGQWGLVEDAWRASVLPIHCLIFCKKPTQPEEVFFTVWVSNYAVLAWPVVRPTQTSARLADGENSSCRWHFVFDFSHYWILPFEVKTPLHGILKGMPLPDLGIFAEVGQPMPVLEYQARHGFSGVPESSMKALLKEVGRDTIESESAGNAIDTQYAMELVDHMLPKLREDEYLSIMHSRLRDHTTVMDDTFDEYINDDMVRDVLRGQDKEAMKGILQKRTVSETFRRKESASIKTCVAEKFAGRPKSSHAKPSQVAALAKKNKVGTAAGNERWWASVSGDMSFINLWRPPIGGVTMDNPNGRFLLTYPGQHRRSISWTCRGADDAALDCLRQLWAWHAAATGEPCPLPEGIL